MTNHYDTLGVARDASADDIKRAFRAKRKAHHPDRQGGSHESMSAVNRANDVLSDPDRRAHYDATGNDGVASSIPEMAESLLVSVFDRLLDTADNIIVAVRRELSSMRDTGADSIEQAKRKLTKLRARRDRVRVKSGQNIVHRLIDSQVAALEQSIAKVKRALEAADAALVMLDAYESDESVEDMRPSLDSMLRESIMRHSSRSGPKFGDFGTFSFKSGGI